MPSIPAARSPTCRFPRSTPASRPTFYETVFGWNIRRRSDGDIAFDDTVGGVSGRWITGRPPSAEPGIVVYTMVDSVAERWRRSSRAGGEVVTPLTAQGPGESLFILFQCN